MIDPRLELLQTITRRQFLGRSSFAMGTMALASFLDSAATVAAPVDNPLGPQEAALRRQGQADDLHSSDRLAAEPRSVRLQAGAGQARRPALPRRIHSRASVSPSPPARPSCWARGGRSSSTARRASGSPTPCRDLAEVADELCCRPLDAHRPVQPRPGRVAGLHRLAAAGPPLAGRLGHLWPGHREPGPARLHRADLQRHAAQRRQELVRLRLPADRLPGRAVPLARAIRCSMFPTRPAWTARSAA